MFMRLISELKRRNVFRMAVLYMVAAWLIMQVGEVMITLASLPSWTGRLILALLAVGFPIALIFSWFYELTPVGISLEKDAERHKSITRITARRMDFIVISLLSAAVILFAVDKFIIDPSRDAVEIEAAVRDVQEQVASTLQRHVSSNSVAVLPFVSMSSGPDDEYFADGLTEEIINSLSQLPELLVIARTSSFTFKGQNVPIPEIADKLGVANIVEGSVRRAGNQSRITAQLNRALDGVHLWSNTYDRSSQDNFAVQADIAERVAAALDIVLSEEKRALMHSTGLRNTEAFIAYQKGRRLFDEAHALPRSETPAVLFEANKYFEFVLELEPEFSDAHLLHADYYMHRIVNAVSLDEISSDAIEDALSQAKADLENASRYASNEGKKLNTTMEFALLAEQWRRLPDLIAAAVNAADCVPGGWWSEFRIGGSASNALLLAQRERECDPLTPYSWAYIARAHIDLGDFEAAIKTATRGMQFAPHRLIADLLISAQIAASQFDEAEAANHVYVEDEQQRQSYQHKIAAARGDAEMARMLLGKMIERFGVESASITDFAISGNRDAANALAARMDARPLGIYSLATSIEYCFCGAPFDLQEAPNFARLIEEAEILWPPSASIKWPLKEW